MRSLRGNEDALWEVEILTHASQYLKTRITVEQRNAQADRMSDNDAAVALNHARRKLFQAISVTIRKQA